MAQKLCYFSRGGGGVIKNATFKWGASWGIREIDTSEGRLIPVLQ